MIMANSPVAAGCIGKHTCANNLAIMFQIHVTTGVYCIETKFVDHIATIVSGSVIMMFTRVGIWFDING